VYQQQSFHTSAYRGNQQGHDNYLRADSQQPSNLHFGSTPVQSQYRGLERAYQPIGPVQSVYGGFNNQQGNFSTSAPVNGTSFGSTGMNNNNYQSFNEYQSQSPSSFHTSSYRGNQPGHDNYLRADSTNPSSFSTGSFQNQFDQNIPYQSQYQPMQNQGQYQPTNAFHTSNYRGNQQGHDNYLRADSTNPSQYNNNFRQF
jgi:hypothetical protein